MHDKNLKGVQRWTYLVTQGENIPLYGKTKGVQEWEKKCGQGEIMYRQHFWEFRQQRTMR